jgi:hypothetical protein
MAPAATGLDPATVSIGPWIGGPGGGREFLLGADGRAVAGLRGRAEGRLVAVGLAAPSGDGE